MKHFTLEELCRSQTATRLGISNKPSKEIVNNLERLVREVLDPLRDKLNKGVAVTSGYRSPSLNRKVGGSITSAHCKGFAADINVPGMSIKELYDFIKHSDLPYDQLIFEGTWVHIGITDTFKKPRKQNLIAHFGKGTVTYTYDDI